MKQFLKCTISCKGDDYNETLAEIDPNIEQDVEWRVGLINLKDIQSVYPTRDGKTLIEIFGEITYTIKEDIETVTDLLGNSKGVEVLG